MFGNTPNQTYYSGEEELITKLEYKVKYNKDIIIITIGKTTTDIIIKSLFYGIKLDMMNLYLFTKITFKSIDESFAFFENIFNQNKVQIKEIKPDILKINNAI